MPPVPTVKKKKPQPRQQVTSASNVYDSYGRSLNSLLRTQKRTNRDHDERITTNSQHVQMYESNSDDKKLIYRDVFPGRKYKLTLSDTTWMGGDNMVVIGYTVGVDWYWIGETSSAPEGNVFDIDMPTVAAVDTLEVRLIGASNSVRGYLEDNTSSSSISAAIARLLDTVSDLVSGQSHMQDDIDDIKDTLQDHEDRIEALEGETPTPEPEPEPEPEPGPQPAEP